MPSCSMIPSRIVIINDRSLAAGGATALALLSARLFSEAGYDVTYITGDDGCEADLPAAVELVTLGQKPLLQRSMASRVGHGLYNPAARRLLEREIARLDGPRVVYHLHGWAQILSPSVFAALGPVESRLVIHAHDFFMACPTGTFFDFATQQVCERSPLTPGCLAASCDKRSALQKAFRVSRFVVRKRLFAGSLSPAAIAVIHPAMVPYLERSDLSADRLHVVRNPARTFRTSRVRAEDNDEIFFIGRVSREKGPRLAAQAARLAGRKLRLIGDGREREELAVEFPEVAFEGWLEHEEIAQRIGKARAIVMPSFMPEPFGLVALEALQSGVPLVAFSDSFIAREAERLGCAFLAGDRQPETLAAAIARLDDDTVVEQASRRAFDASPSLTCTEEQWRDQLHQLYVDLLRNAGTCSENIRAIEAAPALAR